MFIDSFVIEKCQKGYGYHKLTSVITFMGVHVLVEGSDIRESAVQFCVLYYVQFKTTAPELALN